MDAYSSSSSSIYSKSKNHRGILSLQESPDSLSVQWSFHSRNRDSKATSPPFNFGTLEWRIIFYPRAKTSTDNVSLYLELISPVNPEFRYSLSFSFSILNSNPNKTKSRDSSHVFKNTHDNWGFHKFMHHTELFDINNGFIAADEVLTIHTVFKRPKFPKFSNFQCTSQVNTTIEGIPQPMFHCYSCSPGGNDVFCLPCITRCHAEHFIGPMSMSNTKCDCATKPPASSICQCKQPLAVDLYSTTSASIPSPSTLIQNFSPTTKHEPLSPTNLFPNNYNNNRLKINPSEIDIDLLATDANDLPNITCSICTFLVLSDDDLFLSCCETPFHSKCLKSWLQRKNSCPNCRKKNIPYSNISRLYKHIISSLQFKCPLSNLGCKFQGTLTELISHSDSCTFDVPSTPTLSTLFTKTEKETILNLDIKLQEARRERERMFIILQDIGKNVHKLVADKNIQTGRHQVGEVSPHTSSSAPSSAPVDQQNLLKHMFFSSDGFPADYVLPNNSNSS